MTVRIASRVIVNAGARMLSTEEVTAIATEAHRLGRTVAAHATTESAARIAAEAGADSIEHGYRLPDDVLAVMARKGIWTNARRGQVGVSGDPLRDGTALTRPSFVMKGGVVVRHDVRR